MNESAINLVRYILFFTVLIYVVKAFLPQQGLKDKKLYFKFCQLRRDLMHMALTGEVNVDCLSFKFFMRFLSDIIHYSEDYKFGTIHFFRSIYRDSKDLAKDKFIIKLKTDIDKQNKVFKDFVFQIFDIVIRAFDKNPIIWLTIRYSFFAYLFYSLLFNRRPNSSFTQAAGAAKNVRSFSQESACAV